MWKPAASNRRIAWIGLAGAVALGIGAAAWMTLTPVLRPAREVTVVIPPGTGERLEAGAEDTGFPAKISLTQGDTLRLVNQDSQPHLVGGYFVWEDSEVAAPFRDSGTFNYVCSVHPRGNTVFEVREKPALQSLVWTELGLAGLVVAALAIPPGGTRRRGSASILASGGAMMFAGLVLSLNSTGLLAAARDSLGGDGLEVRTTVKAGEVSYLRFCEVCHGVAGDGDGALAASLGIPPADLRLTLPGLSNNALFRVIKDGVPEGGMPGSGDALTDGEISDLIAYLRTLER